MLFGPVGASAATVAAVAVGPLSRSRASEPAARCACDHETRIRENTGNFVRLQHGAHSTASRLLQTSTWRERGTLPNAPPSTTLLSFHLCQHMLNCARAASRRVSTFTAGCLLGSTGSRPTVFFLRKKKEKRWSLVIIRPTLLFGCFSSFVPTAPPTRPQPHPATSSLPPAASPIIRHR